MEENDGTTYAAFAKLNDAKRRLLVAMTEQAAKDAEAAALKARQMVQAQKLGYWFGQSIAVLVGGGIVALFVVAVFKLLGVL